MLVNEKTRDRAIKGMQQNPQQYFNFGFTADDYFVFMVKYALMRAEREVIEEEYKKYLEKKGIKLPQ